MKKVFRKIGELVNRSYELSLPKWLGFCLIIAVAETLILEMLGRHSFLGAFRFVWSAPLLFIFNVFILYFTLTLALLSKRRAFLLGFFIFLWLVLGITNFVVLGFRLTPFSAVNLIMVKDVMSMLDVYFSSFQQILLFTGLFLLLVLLVVAFIFTPKMKKQVHYLQNLLFCLGELVLIYIMMVVGLRTGLLTDRFTNLHKAYQDYGFVYCFTDSIIGTGVDKPDGYSREQVQEVLSAISDVRQEGEKKSPDVVIVQLESFIDMSRIDGLEMDRDPVPSFNAYMEEYPSGLLTVPAIGAGTANTEFEMLTGMLIQLFGAGEYPYKTVISHTPCESLAQLLSRDGYKTHAIHNNRGRFYSRTESYPNLGFDTFTSLEYMNDVEYTSTGWARDSILVKEIEKALDSTEEQDFVFAVSVQGHGKYPTEETPCDIQVTMPDADEETRNEFQYFVQQTYEMDQMAADLKAMLDARGQDYILVLYGDHIPNLDVTEASFLLGDMTQTEYVIVNNMDLDLPDQDIHSYEFPDVLLTAMNREKGMFEKLHEKYYAADPETYDEYVHILQYDTLYGDRFAYEETEAYTAKDTQMGTYPVVITGVESSEEGDLIIHGENFTPFSVAVMGEADSLETRWVDENTLLCPGKGEKNKEGNRLHVKQMDKEGVTVSVTEEFSCTGP